MKTLKLFLFILLPVLILSCKKDEYPILNNGSPVYITADAQTILVYGENIWGMGPQNDQTDIVEDTHTMEDGNNRAIKSEWITISRGDKYPLNTIEIVVQENTSTEDRYYYLNFTHETKKAIAQIIQFGKK